MTHRHSQRGMTLIELIVTLGIIMIVLPATMNFLVSAYRHSYGVDSRSSSQGIGRRAMTTMVTELRQATTGGNGAYAIINAGAQDIAFYANIDADDDVEYVHYFLDGTELKRGVIEPSGDPPNYTGAEDVRVIAQDIRNGSDPIFTYYDESYTGTEDPLAQDVNESLVRYVRFTLTIDDDPDRDPGAFTLTSAAQLRSLKENF